MKKIAILAACMIALSILGGCMTTEVLDNNYTQADFSEEPDFKKWQSHWIFTLVNPDAPQLAQNVCPDGEDIVKIKHQYHFGHQVLQGITLGIWTPTTLKIWCGEPQ